MYDCLLRTLTSTIHYFSITDPFGLAVMFDSVISEEVGPRDEFSSPDIKYEIPRVGVAPLPKVKDSLILGRGGRRIKVNLKIDCYVSVTSLCFKINVLVEPTSTETEREGESWGIKEKH